jgi:hypothetical protein
MISAPRINNSQIQSSFPRAWASSTPPTCAALDGLRTLSQAAARLSLRSRGSCAQNFHHPVVVPSGVLSWGHIRQSFRWKQSEHGDRIVIQGTKLSPADFPLSLACFGRSRQRPALQQSQRLMSAQRNAGCAASTSRPCRSSSRSSTKCCESKQNSTYNPHPALGQFWRNHPT